MNDTGQMCDDRLFWDLEDSAGLHPLQAGLAGEGRPDPGGSGCASSGVVEPATGKIDSLVLAHGYASRVVSSPVPHPITWRQHLQGCKSPSLIMTCSVLASTLCRLIHRLSRAT